MKNRSTGRIDIAVSWIIAMATAMTAQAQPDDLAKAMTRPGWSL